MPADWDEKDLSRTLGLLDVWLDSMRAPDGYAGPVSHWWDSSLVYTGPMFDWRYEGIVCGYINLFQLSRDEALLAKACRAGSDLVTAQLSNGQYRNSSFEHGPKSGGTPHEAAADIALLELAAVLQKVKDPRAATYFSAAERNLKSLISRLWTGSGFADQPENPVLVPNKNATMLEALLLYQGAGGADAGRYVEAAADVILSAQLKDGVRAGATVHRGTFGYALSFGIYTARCLGTFARLMEIDPRPAYRDFMARAARYLGGLICTDGSWLGHYADGRRIAAPIWIAPSGDLLRALLQARPWVEVPESAISNLAGALIRAQTPAGGIPTGIGLAFRGALRPYHAAPDFRDVLPVAGWCDKAFRALSMLAQAVSSAVPADAELSCAWRGTSCLYREDTNSITLQTKKGQMLYYWQKGTSYPSTLNLWQ